MKIENAETRVIKWESLKWWWIKKRKMEREREGEREREREKWMIPVVIVSWAIEKNL